MQLRDFQAAKSLAIRASRDCLSDCHSPCFPEEPKTECWPEAGRKPRNEGYEESNTVGITINNELIDINFLNLQYCLRRVGFNGEANEW